MKICIVSRKECWRNAEGQWCSDAGFTLQMDALGDLFEHTTLVIVEVEQRPGGIPFAEGASVFPLRPPRGKGIRRKLSVVTQLWYYLGRITRHVREADAVYIPVPGDLSLLGLLSSFALRKRVIARYASSWVSNSQTTLMNRVTRILLQWYAGGRNVVLVAGHGDAAPAPRTHWHAPTALWQSELDGIKPRLDRGLSSPPSLVCIGRLSPEKNVPHLIQVMCLLKQQGCQPLPRLTLVGDGPDHQSLEALVRERNCEDIVSFAGQLNRQELSRQLSQADVCVHSSLTEAAAGPKAWLDAMAHGLPVLACEISNAAWTIGADGERGWLVPQGDAQAFAAMLRRILTEPCDWPALRQRARAYAETRTLDVWRRQIGEICTQQWGTLFVDGKLRDSGSDDENVPGQEEAPASPRTAAAHQGKAE